MTDNNETPEAIFDVPNKMDIFQPITIDDDYNTSRDTAYDTGEIVDCARYERCGNTFLTVIAVQDPEHVRWLGARADTFCSQNCLDAWSENGDS